MAVTELIVSWREKEAASCTVLHIGCVVFGDVSGLHWCGDFADKRSVEKVSRSLRCLMLKRFTEALPRRMDKVSLHVDVHDASSILKFSSLLLVFQTHTLCGVWLFGAFNITSVHSGLGSLLSWYVYEVSPFPKYSVVSSDAWPM